MHSRAVTHWQGKINWRRIDSFEQIVLFLSFVLADSVSFSRPYRCAVGCLSFSSLSAATPHSPGLCQSLLHLSKLTRLLGSPETQHLADIPTVSPPQITPSLSALITLPSPSVSPISSFITTFFYVLLYSCCSCHCLIFLLPCPFSPRAILSRCVLSASLLLYFSLTLPFPVPDFLTSQLFYSPFSSLPLCTVPPVSLTFIPPHASPLYSCPFSLSPSTPFPHPSLSIIRLS